jgi:hypothetical protein
MRIFVKTLTGKSKRSPASAIGVQKTKNVHVSIATKKPFSKPYFHETNMKYPIKSSKTIKNL